MWLPMIIAGPVQIIQKVLRFSSGTSRARLPKNCSDELLASLRVYPMLRWSAQLLRSSEIREF